MKKMAKGGWKALSVVTSLGITMAVSVWIGYITGSYLDKWLGTEPWLSFIFSLFGIGAGFKGVFRMINELFDEKEGDSCD